jgi:succinate dehydrogenase / fumarate reductase, cytochrome b subunit
MATPKRPLSPFMIGPYYRPQLTSMLSIAHRATGVLLSLAGFLLAAWLLAVAGGSAGFDHFTLVAASPLGQGLLLLVLFSLVYHLLNGIRHLLWDIGWGYELPRLYATGWIVVGLSFVLTALVAWLAWNAGVPA